MNLPNNNQPASSSEWDAFWEQNDEGLMREGATPFLLPVLRHRNTCSILCVGNGMSAEAPALAYAGFDVDVLDISTVATEALRTSQPLPALLERTLGEHCAALSGSLNVHCGDFRSPLPCPGPYDVVICRRLLQFIPDQDIAAAIDGLVTRLKANGLLVLESQNRRMEDRAMIAFLRERGYAVTRDIEQRKDSIAAPACLSRKNERLIVWVLSSTG